MHRYDRDWNRRSYPSQWVPYDRLYRRRPGSRHPYDRGWTPYDDEVYGRWGRATRFEGYGRYSGRGRWHGDSARHSGYPGAFTARRGGYDRPDFREAIPRGPYDRGWGGAYDDPDRWPDPDPWGAYGPAPRDRYGEEWSVWRGQPESSRKRWRREGRWEGPGGYADDGIQGYFDQEDEGDPDDFRVFEDPYPVDEWDEPTDEEVHEAVQHSLASDGFLDARSIRVEVKDRVVTLRGEVGDYMEARYAWDDAWEAPGVRGVISKLTVAGATHPEASAMGAGTATAGTSAEASESRRSRGKGKENQV